MFALFSTPAILEHSFINLNKSSSVELKNEYFCFSHLFRQDVAYQMRTKTKEECESHYMKNFINNPLFSSTLLSLRKKKDSRFADGAIPFKREHLCSFHFLSHEAAVIRPFERDFFFFFLIFF